MNNFFSLFIVLVYTSMYNFVMETKYFKLGFFYGGPFGGIHLTALDWVAQNVG